MTQPTHLAPTITLNDGQAMPILGFGTWKLQGDEAYRAVRSAIEVGYRHIDTAAIYGNEAEVGRAINDAVAAGDVTRQELFVNSKVWNDMQGAQQVQKAFQDSLRALDQEFLDCYMVHWPWPQRGLYRESYAALANVQGFGQVRSIAVANFNEAQLKEIIAETGIAPVLNQVELHPGFSQQELHAFHEQVGVVTEAWSPLGRGGALNYQALQAPAQKYGKTAAQVALRWMVQQGMSTVPKSANPTRQAENLNIFDFELTAEEIAAITALDSAPGAGRMYADPATFPGELEE
ncbi:aldo/keto reductase [Corynebacterium sp. 153RC1]|uniref:aldo/keto reductase n=1 Tax=unclassified Corynebacterium TaxID=2624378 RepID=UPI00211B9E05|nr:MULTISPECIES: aldo/keto reductase [unclassified Corynebacterium]MCQ9353356.1 aldo/keto reductase [Corynebacterium sp. 209RC1]MCQ9355527.1 aldo/keto reductase [Corynebacterium sp. 1222RC1]MCQ9357664.1 aldo/keto reductase [Corynebacterium sp. 122RC1]MCQ9359871.1 aldo/keto reductase [Corynebacterium sp. 142RC1]MCQ9362000.1 aldo/keto reductase [Corynebacterium sp. 153RC1]